MPQASVFPELPQNGTGVVENNHRSLAAHELRKLVNHEHPLLSVRRQCDLLGLPKSTLYYMPVAVDPQTLRVLDRIDAWYLKEPAAGSHRMVDYLAGEGIEVGHDRDGHLMHRMALRAINQKPRTTSLGDPAERFPSLVELKKIALPDDIWGADITFISFQRVFISLVAIIDLYSRYSVSWKLLNSLCTEFCLFALVTALARGHRPRLFHSGQGCQFTSTVVVT